MTTIARHERLDHCHLCGHRVPALANVWWPRRPSAEHATAAEHARGFGHPPDDVGYLRICCTCARHLLTVAESTDPRAHVHIAPPTRPRKTQKSYTTPLESVSKFLRSQTTMSGQTPNETMSYPPTPLDHPA